MNARITFTVLARTTLPSMLLLSLYFNKLCSDFTLYYRPIFKLENHFIFTVVASAMVISRSKMNTTSPWLQHKWNLFLLRAATFVNVRVRTLSIFMSSLWCKILYIHNDIPCTVTKW